MPPLKRHQVICCVEEKYEHVLICSSSIQNKELVISSLLKSNTMTLKLEVESFMLGTESCHRINGIILISLWKPEILTQVSGIRESYFTWGGLIILGLQVRFLAALNPDDLRVILSDSGALRNAVF